MTKINLDHMVSAYLEAQLWAQPDMEHIDDTLDGRYDISDIAHECVAAVRDELQSVVDAYPELLRQYRDAHAYPQECWEQFGQDFYLTREHHGAGFWDRGLGQLGDQLTNIAHSYGSADMLYDDGTGRLRH
jgi:hypothetical protein